MYRNEFPEIEDWDERSYRNNYNDRCLPAIAALTAVAAFASCRPRSCYPQYGYPYGYYPYYRPVYCSPYFICIPRPCYPR